MSNTYTFVRTADFQFIDIYMWNNDWGTAWHYGGQDSYWSRKGAPSVYRIFSPKTKKVTGIGFDIGSIESQIITAIAENVAPTAITPPGSATTKRRPDALVKNVSHTVVELHIPPALSGRVAVDITGTNGRKVFSHLVETGSSITPRINIRNLAPGAYMIAVSVKGRTIAQGAFLKY